MRLSFFLLWLGTFFKRVFTGWRKCGLRRRLGLGLSLPFWFFSGYCYCCCGSGCCPVLKCLQHFRRIMENKRLKRGYTKDLSNQVRFWARRPIAVLFRSLFPASHFFLHLPLGWGLRRKDAFALSLFQSHNNAEFSICAPRNPHVCAIKSSHVAGKKGKRSKETGHKTSSS